MSDDLDEVDAFLKSLENERVGEKDVSHNGKMDDTEWNDEEVDRLLAESGVSPAKPSPNNINGETPISDHSDPQVQVEPKNDEPNINAAIQDSPVPVEVEHSLNPSRGPSPGIDEAALKQLEEMGYEKDIAAAALLQSQNHVQEAVSLLIRANQGDEAAAETASTTDKGLPKLPPRKEGGVPPFNAKVLQEKLSTGASSFFKNAGLFMKSIQIDRLVEDIKSIQVNTLPLSKLVPISDSLVSEEQIQVQMQLIDEEFETQRKPALPLALQSLIEIYRHDCNRLGVQPQTQVLHQLKTAKENKKDVFSLDLSGCDMGPLRVYILSKLVALLPNLKRLIVEFTDITDDPLAVLLKHATMSGQQIAWLNVSHCWNIKPAGIKHVAVFLQKSPLRYLDLSGITLDIASASLLSQALQLQKTYLREQAASQQEGTTSRNLACLEILKMDFCSLSSPLLEQLLNEFNKSSIKMLGLRGNDLNAEGASIVSSSIQNSALEKLELSENSLKASGLQRLVTCLLQTDCKIREVYLARCDLDAVAMELIAEVIKTNTKIKVLELSENKRLCTDVDAVFSLQRALAVNHTLLELNLQNTGFTFESAMVMAEGLPEVHLEKLSLRHNDQALNPLRANLLNLGNVVKQQGQKAVKLLSQTFNRAVQDYQAAAATSSADLTPKPAIERQDSKTSLRSGPLPSESSYAVLMAFVLALRLNKTIIRLDLIDLETTSTLSDIQSESSSNSNEPVVTKEKVQGLMEEVRSLCGRNAGSDIQAETRQFELPKKDREATATTSNEKNFVRILDTARHNTSVFIEKLNVLTRAGSSTNLNSHDLASIEPFYDRCLASQKDLYELMGTETIVNDERFSDQLALQQSEINVAIARYKKVFSIGDDVDVE